ncbi:MAG: adenylosuccinate lyase [Flavobacteriaceae bacterium]|jgi:adenylosuccinate lyase|nr:adenylosuccinate lyase [Flavobacteriaceae bacterium]MBT4113294.1 adenylosuccinate lyase [Flavobacteriaceae bacterium]MBT4614701.1 adenylosuccinate lyase [Flavobacteriaceae bacterium]MBT5247101.1 adenylosuccinate lyase [Flavobacteriaceae bacterium]MBT5649757.1 adenylosuccinate lyase [Flavobacteriaceae bacterium]
MSSFSLNAISPIDGRYSNKTSVLSNYFSEKSLIKTRILVEVEYFISLCEIPLPELKSFKKSNFKKLRDIYENFSEKDATAIKEIEKKTNHDVKAVEYFIKNEFDKLNLNQYKEFIHFGLTSQDINNTAIPLSLKYALNDVYYPELDSIISRLNDSSKKWSKIPMLARTHGQPASPTRLGKEIDVFKVRIIEQLSLLKLIPIAAKFGGATGNYNAHNLAYPKIDWKEFSKKFVLKNLGLKHSFPTTQIEHYDHLAAIFDNIKRINTILIDLNRDLWLYVSMDYFKQKIKDGEIGSSAMPHKVNPIDFENSEGNLGIANANFEHLSSKLPISRLQRDLTDSTVLRNIGVPFAHTLIAFKSTIKGLNKLIVNKEKISVDLNNNWAIIAEAIQTILRREGYPQPYEALKSLTRVNSNISKEEIHNFINKLDVNNNIKKELLKITPENYTGI